MRRPVTRPRSLSLRDRLGDGAGRFLWGARGRVALSDLGRGTGLGGRLAELSGRSVLLLPVDQLAAAVALIELDGVARRMVLCPPDLPAGHLRDVIHTAAVDAIVADPDRSPTDHVGVPLHVAVTSTLTALGPARPGRRATEWVLLTSGTTGAPKLVAHSLATLTAPIKSGRHEEPDVVWGTFYDIRRYGGLQIFLRAVLGHGSLVLSDAREAPTAHLLRLATHGVTHLTGTPSHWRRALMSPSARAIRPRYVRLSGEIADQAILNRLRAFYPEAAIGHAFASTEAGVGFEVDDGLEGFPARIVGAPGEVDIQVEEGSLRLRSTRTALRIVGNGDAPLLDARGFVDTGDIAEQRGDRYFFQGRRSGVINVGGQKVFPEEVEAVLNLHPAVRMSCVRPRRSSITGSLVVADVVLNGVSDTSSGRIVAPGDDVLKDEILQLCRDTLPRHKVPVALNVVPTLDVGASGKMARHGA